MLVGSRHLQKQIQHLHGRKVLLGRTADSMSGIHRHLGVGSLRFKVGLVSSCARHCSSIWLAKSTIQKIQGPLQLKMKREPKHGNAFLFGGWVSYTYTRAAEPFITFPFYTLGVCSSSLCTSSGVCLRWSFPRSHDHLSARHVLLECLDWPLGDGDPGMGLAP